MKYTIEEMHGCFDYIDEKKKKQSLIGYAFMISGHCWLIVYGENLRDNLIKLLDK